MIRGINHINLSVTDIERSFDFYHRVVGLTPLCRWPEGAYFLAGNDWFCINVHDAVSVANDYTHYAFSVNATEFSMVVQRLKDAGVTAIKDNFSEGESYYFADPDGHKLELHVGDWQSRIIAQKLKPWPNCQFFV